MHGAGSSRPRASTSISRRCWTPCRPASARNPPIGDLDREYGHTPDDVCAATASRSPHGLARGRRRRHRQSTSPGLGRVRGNTDTDQRRHRLRHDAAPTPYLAAVRARRSTPGRAVRDDVDGDLRAHRPRHAGGVLADDRHRHAAGDLGFPGVIISDDIGAAAAGRAATRSGSARSSSSRRAGHRAHRRRRAQAPTMTAALLARAQHATRRSGARSTRPRLRVLRPSRRAGLLLSVIRPSARRSPA